MRAAQERRKTPNDRRHRGRRGRVDLRWGVRAPKGVDHFEELHRREHAEGSYDVLRQVAVQRLGDGARDGGKRVGVAAERGGKADGLTLLQDVIL